MSAVREAWTDERLDDLAKRMDDGFGQVDRRFERIDADLRELRTEMNDRFDRLQLALIAFGGTIAAALIAAPHL